MSACAPSDVGQSVGRESPEPIDYIDLHIPGVTTVIPKAAVDLDPGHSLHDEPSRSPWCWLMVDDCTGGEQCWAPTLLSLPFSCSFQEGHTNACHVSQPDPTLGYTLPHLLHGLPLRILLMIAHWKVPASCRLVMSLTLWLLLRDSWRSLWQFSSLLL